MGSRLSATQSEFAEGRWADEPPLHPSEVARFETEYWSLGRRIAVALGLFVMVFCIGVAATLAWQSYAKAARGMIGGWSPALAWLAPPAAPAEPSTPSAGVSPDQLAAIARSLAVVRQSVDKLAADIIRLQAARQDPSAGRASAPPSVAVATPARKPAPGAQTPAR